MDGLVLLIIVAVVGAVAFHLLSGNKRTKGKHSPPTQVSRVSDSFAMPARDTGKAPVSSARLTVSESSPGTSKPHLSREGNDADDDLASFTITVTSSPGRSGASDRVTPPSTRSESSSVGRTEASRPKVQADWVAPGKTVVISGQSISGGNFYHGENLASYWEEEYPSDVMGSEVSLVSSSLPIKPGSLTYKDDTLDYWPSYRRISPTCRSTYLQWLAGPRNQPEIPVGYVFIYFAGLERRILLDNARGKVSADEYQQLFVEVVRLNQVYGGLNHSFNRYSTRLLETMCLMKPDLVRMPDELGSFQGSSLLFRVGLSRRVQQGQPVDADLALQWLHNTAEYSLRTTAKRCSDEFAILFRHRFQERYPQGIVVKPNKTTFRPDYLPASGSLRGYQVDLGEFIDPSILKAPVKKLAEIAEECTAALEPYSRYIGRADSAKDDARGWILLPDIVIQSVSLPVLTNLQSWLSTAMEKDLGIVDVRGFLRNAGIAVPDKLSKKELDLMQAVSQKLDVGFAPDPRFHHAKPELDGKMVVFPQGHGARFAPSPLFNQVSLALRLGVMVAASDGTIDDHELTALHKLIEHHDDLSLHESRSLHAYLRWRSVTGAGGMAGLVARLSSLEPHARHAIATVVVRVAVADGVVAPDEIKQLEKLYKALSLDPGQVASDIHNASTTITSSVVVKGPASDAAQGDTGFTLDEAALARHEEDTQHVQTLLGQIFMDDGEELVISETEDDAVSGDTAMEEEPEECLPGLDDKHAHLYRQLLGQERWARADVEALCRALPLMVDGALEKINDWACDRVGVPVIYDEGDILIDRDIVDELGEE